MRLTSKQIEGLKSRFGVDRLWSYSRLTTFAERPFEYRVAYLEKSARSTSVYTIWGTNCHDLVQDAYTGEYGFDEMGDKFEQKLADWIIDNQGFGFPNENIEKSYFENIRHYYHNPEPIDCEMVCERPILYQLEGDKGEPIVFIGYVDGEYWGVDEEGNKKYYVVDFKSSSKSGFSGKQLKEKSKQLMLYSAAISQQRGIPLEDIVCRFDMLKYVNVSYLQKNGKWRTSAQERRKWVETQEKKIRTLMLENGADFIEIDLDVAQALHDNNMDRLPDYVKEKFKVSNCYIDVPVTQEDIDSLNRFIIDNVTECVELEQGDWEINFPEPNMDTLGDFYYSVLAPQIRNQSKTWQENKGMKLRTENITSSESEDFFNSLFGNSNE